MSARFIVADVFDGLSQLDDGSVDLVVTSPPFLALRSYLPADHPDKSKEIGSEATPAEFIDTLLAVTAELRRVLAPHGSLCLELGDTYAGSGGAGGDYLDNGWREGQEPFRGSALRGGAWPLNKSKTLIPQLYEIALAYGINPLTGQPSPAGQWRIRNVVTWARPNPPVGALGDKWRPATSDLIVACTSSKRYWDNLATRKHNNPDRFHEGASPFKSRVGGMNDIKHGGTDANPDYRPNREDRQWNTAGAPLLDYWEIPPGGYRGSHYAVFPEELVVPCVKAMCPEKVCRVCGEPARRIVGEPTYIKNGQEVPRNEWGSGIADGMGAHSHKPDGQTTRVDSTLGFTDCGHDDWRPGLVLDPFAGSGTTLAVATGHGHDAIGIDLDSRNADLAMERVGPFLMEIA